MMRRDHAGCGAGGHVGHCDPRRACRADRAVHDLVHAAAAARHHLARDHDRHGAGDVGAAADAAGARAWPADGAGRRLAAGAGQQQEVVEEQIAPTPPQEKPEVVAPPEQKPETSRPDRSPRKRSRTKPIPVKPKVVRPEAKKPNGGAAGAAHGGAAPCRTPGPGRLRAPAPGHRRRRSHPIGNASRAHLKRFNQYPPGAKAASAASRGVSLRSAAADR